MKLSVDALLADDPELPLLPAEGRALCKAAATLGLEQIDLTTTRTQAIERSKAAGLFTLTQPRSHGGLAASQLTLCAVRDTLGATNVGHAGALLGPGPGVLAGVDGVLKTHYLDPLLSGSKTAGFGITEPADAPRPTEATADGDHYRVTGQKSYVTGGASVDFINTLVQIDGKPTLLVIDADAEGVTRERVFETLDGSRHAAFRFDAVRVPGTHLIGNPGEGLPKALGQIGDTRLAIAASCVGSMRWVYRYLVEHLQGPQRSGGRRGDPSAVRLRLGRLFAVAYGARSMLYRTARRADEGSNVINEAIACKVSATEGLTEIIDTAIQLVGGSAVVTDHPLAVHYRRVRSLRLAEGTTDVLYQNIARGRLELGKGLI